MRTSNKLLLGFLLFTLAGIVSLAIAAKITTQFQPLVGNGKKVSESRPVAHFTKVSVRGPLKVYIGQGPSLELKLHADENLMSEVESKVENGELQVHRLLRQNNRKDTVAVFVMLDTLKQLEFSGGSTVRMLTQIKGNEIKIGALSGSVGDLNLNYHTLAFEARAGASVHLRGEVNQADFVFRSGAVVEAYHLKIANCDVEGSSGGVAKVHVSNQLNVQVASGAVLEYDGTGKVDILKTSSGGAVQRR